MRAAYINTGESCVADIPRNHSSLLAYLVLIHFYPNDLAAFKQGIHLPDALRFEDYLKSIHCQTIVPRTEIPDRDCLIVVRDPIDRFRSALYHTGKSVGQAIDELTDTDDRHFIMQSEWVPTHCSFELFRFGEDLAELTKRMGLSEPVLDRINVSGDKPSLSKSERSRVAEHYRGDVRLYNSIK